MRNSKKMLDIYNKQLPKDERKGWNDFFKEATEKLFEAMNETLTDMEECPFTFEDVQYVSGYFIFEFGDNKVVHFHVKEIPGWLFGIWWGEPVLEHDEDKELQIKVSYEMFAQYENNINKFKPAASNICITDNITFNGEWDLSISLIEKMIFIHNEPELAFCEDCYGWNYEYKYHTRAEAKKEFKAYLKHQNLKETLLPQLDKNVYDVVAEILEELISKGQAIIDEIEYCTPKYDILLDSKLFGENIETGCYDWKLIFTDNEIKKIRKAFDKSKKIAKKNILCWSRVFNECVHVVEHKRFLKIRRERRQK